MRIAFACHPTTGHLNPLLSMALAVREAGHEPVFFVPGAKGPPFRVKPDVFNNVFEVPRALARHGLPAVLLPPSLATAWHAWRLVRATGFDELERAFALFSTGVTGFARRILREHARAPVDALVFDFAFFGASLAAEKAGIPYAAVYHTGLPFRGPGVPPFGTGLPIGGAEDEALSEARRRSREAGKTLGARISAARRAFGLPAAAGPLEVPLSPWLNLVLSNEAIEAPREGLGERTVFVGPSFSTRAGDDAEGFPFDWLHPDAFKVYVSLGTVFNDRPRVFEEILRGLDLPGVQVIVSAGASTSRLQKRPPSSNALIFERVPQLALLSRVDLVVGHGGNNSTNETLAAGRPLLVVPVGGEQRDNARRVEWLGAGLSLELDRVSSTTVRALFERLRTEASFSARARALGARLAETDGAQTAALLVQELARTRRPFALPAGAPRSVTRAAAPELVARGFGHRGAAAIG